jgi:hypothetical protein
MGLSVWLKKIVGRPSTEEPSGHYEEAIMDAIPPGVFSEMRTGGEACCYMVDGLVFATRPFASGKHWAMVTFPQLGPAPAKDRLACCP